MRKEYIKPIITIVKLSTKYGVMEDMSYFGEVTEEPQLSKPHSPGGGLWDNYDVGNGSDSDVLDWTDSYYSSLWDD